MLGLKKPVPITRHTKPRKNIIEVSKAMAAWPSVIIAEPIITALRDPIYLSAIIPPIIGVK
ncbi:hypothetical protein D3C81_1199040 [compost metagenome]